MAEKHPRSHYSDDMRPRAGQALLLIDVINDMEFPGGRKLLKHALPAARAIAALKRRARAHGIPVIYVNDNFGRWQSDFQRQVDRCLEEGICGREVARLLKPDSDDYFVLKPKHSGFFSTTLETLLHHLGVRKLILTGFAGDICVLYTANDAYMRDFEIQIPSDCIASEDPAGNAVAISQMKRCLKADVRKQSLIRFLNINAGGGMSDFPDSLAQGLPRLFP